MPQSKKNAAREGSLRKKFTFHSIPPAQQTRGGKQTSRPLAEAGGKRNKACGTPNSNSSAPFYNAFAQDSSIHLTSHGHIMRLSQQKRMRDKIFLLLLIYTFHTFFIILPSKYMRTRMYIIKETTHTIIYYLTKPTNK